MGAPGDASFLYLPERRKFRRLCTLKRSYLSNDIDNMRYTHTHTHTTPGVCVNKLGCLWGGAGGVVVVSFSLGDTMSLCLGHRIERATMAKTPSGEQVRCI